MDIFDLEPYELDLIHFGQLETLYQDVVNNHVDQSDWSKIRTSEYWEIHDRFYNPKTRKSKRMKLFLFAYIQFSQYQVADFSHISEISPDERPYIFTLKPNLNFYSENS
jgi:hypothetical protein